VTVVGKLVKKIGKRHLYKKGEKTPKHRIHEIESLHKTRKQTHKDFFNNKLGLKFVESFCMGSRT